MLHSTCVPLSHTTGIGWLSSETPKANGLHGSRTSALPPSIHFPSREGECIRLLLTTPEIPLSSKPTRTRYPQVTRTQSPQSSWQCVGGRSADCAENAVLRRAGLRMGNHSFTVTVLLQASR